MSLKQKFVGDVLESYIPVFFPLAVFYFLNLTSVGMFPSLRVVCNILRSPSLSYVCHILRSQQHPGFRIHSPHAQVASLPLWSFGQVKLPTSVQQKQSAASLLPSQELQIPGHGQSEVNSFPIPCLCCDLGDRAQNVRSSSSSLRSLHFVSGFHLSL